MSKNANNWHGAEEISSLGPFAKEIKSKGTIYIGNTRFILASEVKFSINVSINARTGGRFV